MKILLNVLWAALLLLTVAGCERNKAPMRGTLEISGPPGLRTEIGGKVFSKNPQRLRLNAKQYLVKCSAPGFRVRYYIVDIRDNDNQTLRAELQSETAAVLIESTPAGAQVFYEGAPRGTTPAVIADLPPGDHKAVLKLPGHADCEVKWSLTDARPVLVRGTLESNSGTIVFASEPEGAKILIDGVEAGVTPARIERAEGRYRVRLEAPGCLPAECTVVLKRGQTETVQRQLAMKPARLTVESVPDGAEILINGEKRGVAPCVIENLAAGTYTVRAVLALHEPAEREIKLVAGSSDTLRLDLVSGVGSCRIVVWPAGVALRLNGAPIGVVKPRPGDPKAVLPVVLRDLTPGTYRLGMSHPDAQPSRREITFTVQKGKETPVEARMWVPDCEITYHDGESHRGILVAENPVNILFGMKQGIEVEIKRDLLRSIRWIPTHEIICRDGSVHRGIIKAEKRATIVFESEPGKPIEIVLSSIRSIRPLRAQE